MQFWETHWTSWRAHGFDAIEDAGVRTRAIERRLRSVEELPAGQAAPLLPSIAEDTD
mgnify:CR=1 FL=1